MIVIKISVFVLSLLFIFNNTCFAESDIQYCSQNTTKQIRHVENNLEKLGYSLPPKITCDIKLTELLLGDKIPKDYLGLYSNIPNYGDFMYIKDECPKAMYVVYHEAGHYNYKLRHGDKVMVRLKNVSIKDKDFMTVMLEVSSYATTDMNEFLAEVFAKKCFSGYKPSKNIKNIYI